MPQQFLICDTYPTLEECEQRAAARAEGEGIPIEAAKDRLADDLLGYSWKEAWETYGGTLEGHILSAKYEGISFQLMLPETFQDTGDVGLEDGEFEVFIRPAIRGFLDGDELLPDALEPAAEPVMQLTIDRDPESSGSFMTMEVRGSEKYSADLPRHVLAGMAFDEIVYRFFDLRAGVSDRPWQASYGSLADLVEHCRDIEEQLLRVENVFGARWAAKLAQCMLLPCPWNSSAYAMVARDEDLSLEERLDLAEEGYRAALIEAGGALPPAGKDDDWSCVERRQAIQMMAMGAELMEKLGRHSEAVAILEELEKRVPRDNLGLHGRSKAVGRLN